MAKIYVLRGLQGSGKSSVIEELVRDTDGYNKVCSSDLYPGLYGSNGSFNPQLLPQSHGWCLRRFIEACKDIDIAVIVVDNTNLSVAEMAPYIAVGQAYGHDVEVLTIECDPAVAAARNTHGVPADRYAGLKARMDEGTKGMMPWWKHTVRQAWMPQAQAA